MTRRPELIEVDRIFLYEENPRHEPLQSEPEIIEHLCKDEKVYHLARSISESGTNPLELLGVVELPGSGARSTRKSYQAWEGNRRVCAIKLLNDPDRAPAHLRKDFARLAAASTYVPIKHINAVVFDDHDDLRFWMGIIHDGAQGGIGRLNWDAAQKARHFGSNRNKAALSVLDAAEAMNLISKEERAGKLTTVQRFLNRAILKEAIGLDTSNPDDLTYNRPLGDFRSQFARFMADVKSGAAHSRMSAEQVDAYGRKLARSADISGERIEPLSVKKSATAAAAIKTMRRTKPKQPRPLTHLAFDKALSASLERIGNAKLENLYYSICSVSIEHTPLLTVGVWAFVESLAALAGKNPDNDFLSFFSNQRLSNHGFGSGKALTPLREALTRIQRNGNSTKHHEVAATFDGKQLSNDLTTVTPLLIKTIDSIASQKTLAAGEVSC